MNSIICTNQTQYGGVIINDSSDTFFANCDLLWLWENDCFQVFTNRAAYTKAYRMESKVDTYLLNDSIISMSYVDKIL